MRELEKKQRKEGMGKERKEENKRQEKVLTLSGSEMDEPKLHQYRITHHQVYL